MILMMIAGRSAGAISACWGVDLAQDPSFFIASCLGNFSHFHTKTIELFTLAVVQVLVIEQLIGLCMQGHGGYVDSWLARGQVALVICHSFAHLDRG